MAHDFGGVTSPSSWALRNRMYKIAVEAGLSEITPEAVNLMTFAMEVPNGQHYLDAAPQLTFFVLLITSIT